MMGYKRPAGRPLSRATRLGRALDLSQEAGMRADLVVGGHLPDLELPDHRWQSVRLSKLAAGYPLILVFCRGYW